MLFSPFFLNLSHFECCWGQHFTLRKWSSFNKKSFHQISKMNKILCGYWKVDACPSHHWTELSVFLKKILFLLGSTSDLSFFLSLSHTYTHSLYLSVSLTHVYSPFLSYALFFTSTTLCLLYTHIRTHFYTPSLSFIHLSTIHTHTHSFTHTQTFSKIYSYIYTLFHRDVLSFPHTHIILYFFSLSRTHTLSLLHPCWHPHTYTLTHTWAFSSLHIHVNIYTHFHTHILSLSNKLSFLTHIQTLSHMHIYFYLTLTHIHNCTFSLFHTHAHTSTQSRFYKVNWTSWITNKSFIAKSFLHFCFLFFFTWLCLFFSFHKKYFLLFLMIPIFIYLFTKHFFQKNRLFVPLFKKNSDNILQHKDCNSFHLLFQFHFWLWIINRPAVCRQNSTFLFLSDQWSKFKKGKKQKKTSFILLRILSTYHFFGFINDYCFYTIFSKLYCLIWTSKIISYQKFIAINSFEIINFFSEVFLYQYITSILLLNFLFLIIEITIQLQLN